MEKDATERCRLSDRHIIKAKAKREGALEREREGRGKWKVA